MLNTLDIFNCGTSIKRQISTFYTNVEAAAKNINGFTTNWFKPSRGVRQGCPLSPYLFVLSVELLSNKIRQDPSIKGIKISGNEIKVSQFADDINRADLTSVENALRTVGEFGVLAGLKINIKNVQRNLAWKVGEKQTQPSTAKMASDPGWNFRNARLL